MQPAQNGHHSATDQAPPVIHAEELTKIYHMGDTEVRALDGISLTIARGDYLAIVGASGSGKSTLMNIIGLLDRPTSGVFRLAGADAGQLSRDRMALLRNREIGFVFQRFNLLPRTSAQRQVEVPLFYADVTGQAAAKRAKDALERVGLGSRLRFRPDELSGGQQQRVAIARALVTQPSILLADEPTGALDSKTGADVMALFDDLNQQGLTVILVTHDARVAQHAHRRITLSDGVIVSDE